MKIPHGRTRADGRADGRQAGRFVQLEQRRTRYLQTVIQEGVDNFNGEARGAVQAIPLCVIRWTCVHVECDVGSIRWRRRPRFRRRARRAGICWQSATINRCAQSSLSLSLLAMTLATRYLFLPFAIKGLVFDQLNDKNWH